MKLAPPQNTLQPLPANVQPALSQSVQRSATPADLQTIQNAQTQQSETQAQQGSVTPVQALMPSTVAGPTLLWIAIVAAVLVVGAVVWFWRSF